MKNAGASGAERSAGAGVASKPVPCALEALALDASFIVGQRFFGQRFY
jgi:hypothetical protein